MGKSAGRFAGAHGRINPAFIKKATCNVGHFRRKSAISAQHRVARFIPTIGLGRHIGERCIAIPMVELFHAEPFGFQLVIAMRETRMRVLYSTHQSIDHFTFNAVRQMAGVSNVLKTAPAVRDFFVFAQRIGDERKRTQIFF